MDEMKEILVTRLPDGRLSMTGVGIVRLGFNYRHVLGKGGQGVVFGGKIFSVCGERESLVMEVMLYNLCSIVRLIWSVCCIQSTC